MTIPQIIYCILIVGFVAWLVTRLFIHKYQHRRYVRIIAREEDRRWAAADRRWLRERMKGKDIDPEDFYLQRIGLEQKDDTVIDIPHNLWS